MRTSSITLLLLIFYYSSFAQTTITIRVKQSFGTKAKLFQFEGKQRVKIDSCALNVNGDYQFTLPANAPQGQYRVQVGKSGNFDILVANEPQITLESVAYAIEDSLVVVTSEENKIFLNYMRSKHDKEQRKWLIESLYKYYPNSSQFYQILKAELNKIETNFYNEASTLAQIDTNLLVSSYINLDLEPITSSSKFEVSDITNATTWWKGVDLTKTSLLNTPLLEKKLWNFIEQLQGDLIFDKEQQDSVFIQNIAQLLEKPMASPIRKLIVGSLCLGFAESDYYLVLQYLIDNGGQLACSITNDAETMKRIGQERNIAIGNKVLDFSFAPTSSDKKMKLSSVQGQYKLLLFWSAWCPHCVEMLPKLKELYTQFKPIGLEIIGISVDVDDQSLIPFIEAQTLPWINTTFTQKNEEKLSSTFNVDGTPKMILLDKNLRVISKPTGLDQLRNKLLRIDAAN